jgi:hypothetical protein
MMRLWAKWFVRGLAAVIAAVLVAYVVDGVVYKLRGSPQGAVAVNRFLSVPLKGQKTEYDYLGTASAPCAKSLFPQGGLEPCWHLLRNPNQWEKL